jgi:hypothetical protein
MPEMKTLNLRRDWKKGLKIVLSWTGPTDFNEREDLEKGGK